MSTAAVAVVIGNTPNRFHGLDTIGKIFFILALVLFIAFNALIATRFILVPDKFLASLHHPVESLFVGSYWVTVALLLTCMQLYGAPSVGHWLIKALEILFWTWSVSSWPFGSNSGSVPTTLRRCQNLVWCYHATRCWMRLMVSALPDPPTRPGMFVSVGPAGYTAHALISLGRQAPKVFGDTELFGITTLPMGDVIKVIGILAGFFVILFSFWFFCVSLVSVLAGVKEMSFTLNWWAFVFPNAGLTLASIQTGAVLESAGINGVCSALTIGLVIMWIVCAIANIRAVWKGEIIWPGKDEDKSDNDPFLDARLQHC
ncbi:malic acid transporter, partial [Aureobasidium melanogenum]